VLYPEHGATVEELKAFATWSRNTRLAQSERVTYDMPGTLASDGEIWEPGQLVSVRDDQIGIDATLVISSARVRVDANGETTQLDLTRPEAYTQQPIPEADLIHKLRKR
jgi:prophage tail gpP-like protein